MTRSRLALLALGAVALVPFALHERATPAQASVRCGVERWAVKTLTDAEARRVSFNAIPSSVQALSAIPKQQTGDSRVAPFELRTYRVTATLVSAKVEADSDIHLVIQEGPETMIVEFPNVACTYGAQHRYAMAKARQAFEQACGLPSASRFTPLSGTATIVGVGFADRFHGQRGVARNAVELHPVVRFASTCR